MAGAGDIDIDDDDFGDLYTDIPTLTFTSFKQNPSIISSKIQPSSNKQQNNQPYVEISRTREVNGVGFCASDVGLGDNVGFKCELATAQFGFVEKTKGLGGMDLNDSGFGGSDVGLGDNLGFKGGAGSGREEIVKKSKSSEVGLGGVGLKNGDVGQVGEEGVDYGGVLGDFGDDPVIPGIGSSGLEKRGDEGRNGDLMRQDGDGWDSEDSEDDLRIVLNEGSHGNMVMERNGMVGNDDDEDEDDEPLIIVSDIDTVHRTVEEQERGEDQGMIGCGERKESIEAVKANGGVPVAPRAVYNNHGYTSLHSQFKYVRPGTAPLPSAPSVSHGGAPGKVPTSVSGFAGRGRGDWCPNGAQTQNSFQPGFWGSNMSGRGFGSGLDFTLPSHKTIFQVDIDGFEEKPWKYPGIDLSYFFNFDLNEETWKEYRKQLEQTRLESTMQSRIRVHESERSQKEYDSELPPELAAAAAAAQDPLAENTNAFKKDVGLADIETGAASARPPMPIGRPIPVSDIGNIERLPSTDSRPPRFRESDDALIVILPGGSLDGAATAADETSEQEDHGDPKRDPKDDTTREDSPQFENHGSGEYAHANCGSNVDGILKTYPASSSPPDDIRKDERDSSSRSLPRDQVDGLTGSSPANSLENNGSMFGERGTNAVRERSGSLNSDWDTEYPDDLPEKSTKNIRAKHSHDASSPAPPKDSILDDKVVSDDASVADDEPVGDDEPVAYDELVAYDEPVTDYELVADDEEPGRKKEDPSKHRNKPYSSRKPKLVSHVEQSKEESDNGENLKRARSSDSKAAEKSRYHGKRSHDVEEDIFLDGRSMYTGDVKRHRSGYRDARTEKDHEGGLASESERNYQLAKGRDDCYSHRDRDPYLAQHFPAKPEGLEWRKERDYVEGSLHRQDDNPYGKLGRAEERKYAHDSEVSRRRGKGRGAERSYKDVLRSSKVMENGNWRGYGKDVGMHNWESTVDPRNKKMEEDIYMRHDHTYAEEFMVAYRETSRRHVQEIDEQLRDGYDDGRFVRQQDESWSQRERIDRQTERDEWYVPKQSYEENLYRSERDDSRRPALVGHSSVRDDHRGYDRDYLHSDTRRNGETLKQKERLKDEYYSQKQGSQGDFAYRNQFVHEGKRARKEKSGARSDVAVHASDRHRTHEKKHRESRKARESEGRSKRHREENIGKVEMAGARGITEHYNLQRENSLHHQHGKDLHEDASGDDQHGSKRGQSKLEHWTSHEDRNFDTTAKLSSSSKAEDTTTSILEEPEQTMDMLESSISLDEGKNAGSRDSKDTETKPVEDLHLETVEKFKKRSERFKPLPSEKDVVTKKKETEPLLPSQSEAPANPEGKPERPPRRRKWISS